MENHIVELISKYLNRTILADEFEELKQWISDSEENRMEFETIVCGYKDQLSIDFLLKNRVVAMKSKRRFLLARSIAAILILGVILGSAVLLSRDQSNEISEKTIVPSEEKNRLLPSSENRLIVTENGKCVEIDAIATQGVEVTANGLDYSKIVLSDSMQEINSIPTSIKIPKGKRFQLILSDGTKLWINSDTYVEYESVFKGKERRIKVMGEVYLEVAHNAEKPFIVEAYNTDIKVLGTKFNVSAYPGDVLVSTTLVEGSVLVNDETVLSPNEQLLFNKHTSKSNLQKVDVSEYTSWINGVCRFNQMSLVDLSKLFNRLYGVVIEIENEDVSAKLFTGVIDTSISCEEMFEIIMKTTKINYTIEKEKIIIR